MEKNEAREVDEYTQDGTVDLYGRMAIRSKTGSWKSARFIFVSQFWTVLALWGVGNNLVLYLSDVMHVNSASAANTVSNWSGTTYLFPIVGAFLADASWGRFWSSVIFFGLFLWGQVIVTVSAIIPSLRPAQCQSRDESCQKASSFQLGLFIVGIYQIAIGTGASSASLTPFGADQFDEDDKDEKQQKSSYFNWLYQAFNFGYTLSATLFVYIQNHVSWGIGYGVCVMSAILALLSLLLGIPFYRYRKVGKNPFVGIAQVCVACVRKWRLQTPSSDQLCQEHTSDPTREGHRILHTSEFRFLDKAAIKCGERDKLSDELTVNEWRLCTVTQVEEVKCMLRIVPIFMATILYSTVYTQLSTFFPLQGQTMDQTFGSIELSPATVGVFEGFSVIIVIVLYDKIMVPCLRKFTGHPQGITELQRIAIGLGLSVVAMGSAALVETKRLHVVRESGVLEDPNSSEQVPLSIFWQAPQYIIVGASETFVYIGMMEFSYGQSPERLRSVGSAMSSVSQAIGSYLSTILVSLVNGASAKHGSRWIPDDLNHGHLDEFFWLVAALSAANLALFVVCAHRYRYVVKVHHVQRSDESNTLLL